MTDTAQQPQVIEDVTPGQFYTAGYIAKKCDISRNFLWRLVKDGVVPGPDFRTKTGRDCYTLHQVEAIVVAWRQHGLLLTDRGRDKIKARLRDAILKEWKEDNKEANAD